MPAETAGVDLTKTVRVEHKAAGVTTPVAGHLRYEQIKVAAIAAGATAEQTIQWDYDVDLDSGAVFGLTDDADGAQAQDPGDEVDAWVDVGSIGTIRTAHAINDTVIGVADSVVANVDVGDGVSIGADLYEVIAKDETVGVATITLKVGLIAAAAVNDPVNLTRFFVGKPGVPIALGPNGKMYKWGEETLDSTRIPSGAVLHLRVKNSSGTKVKTAWGQLAILY